MNSALQRVRTKRVAAGRRYYYCFNGYTRQHSGLKRQERVDAIVLSNDMDILTPFQGRSIAINCLALDHQETSFLLAGGNNGVIALFDVNLVKTTGDIRRFSSIAKTKRKSKNMIDGHKYAVTAVNWFNEDTGLFISSSMDRQVIVWDTNMLVPACHFNLHSHVYACGITPLACTHHLIACGSESTKVQLCDMTSGAATHSLIGHTGSVLSLAWNPANEFILATGSTDKTIRIWDIRKSGSTACLSALDMYSQSLQLGYNNQEGNNQRKKKRKLNQQSITPHSYASRSIVNSHNGAINGLKFMHRGDYLVSSGTDNCIRFWQNDTLHSGNYINTLVNFDDVRNTNKHKPLYFDIADNGTIFKTRIFHPQVQLHNSSIMVYNAHSGEIMTKLSGHYDTVNCCLYRRTHQQLYTAADDGAILLWEAPSSDPSVYDEDEPAEQGVLGGNEDDWSSSDG